MPRNSFLGYVTGGGVIREMIVLRNKEFSESKEDNKSKKDKATDTSLEIGSAATAGVGLGAIHSTGKKGRIRIRKAIRDGYKEGSTKVLHENMGKLVLSNEPSPVKRGMIKYGKEQLKEIPKRAAELAKKEEKIITNKNKRVGKIALGISAGLLGARAIRGISEKNKNK